MKFKKTNLSGIFIIIPSPNKDDRGFFQRLFCKKIFKKNKIENSIVQINNSFNKKKRYNSWTALSSWFLSRMQNIEMR